MEKLLLHICCAPCSVACIKQLREEGIEPTGFWYNPNIHPYMEYRARRDTLIEYAKSVGLALEIKDEYGLRAFTKAVADHPENRCGYCYAVRMEETARYAKEHGFTAIATTLTVSPYQNHSLIFEIGKKAAEKYGIRFLPYDFSPHFREGQAEARELELYMQKYCGCIYSEEERFQAKIEKDRKRFTKDT
ncbi:MAG: epoxyqueuosine reductase QueH [Clostridia bacterium]|nr:epoxyqueuosine reductase QueH [Clostridia bacterium]